VKNVLNDPELKRHLEIINEHRRLKESCINPAVLRLIEERRTVLNALGVGHTGFNDDVRSRLLKHIEATNRMGGASLYQTVQEANRFFLRFSDSISADFAAINKNIQPAFRQEVIESHLSRITEISALAQSALAGIRVDEVAKMLMVGAHTRNLLAERDPLLSPIHTKISSIHSPSHKTIS
jgi:hypothetical protein